MPFFRTFQPRIKPGIYYSVSEDYAQLIAAIRTYADSFIAIAAKYTPEPGVLFDGFNKTDGSPIGVRGFSWAHAAALSAFGARDGVTPRSWGASGITPSPSYHLKDCDTTRGNGGSHDVWWNELVLAG